MIIVNYWHDLDYDSSTDGYSLHLVATVNDLLDLMNDIQLIELAIDNASEDEFMPKAETLYEIHLSRATIDCDPVPEPAFAIDKVVQLRDEHGNGAWSAPIVRM